MENIMELQNVLNNRRSMRNYDAAKKVTKEQVETIINAAILAPSWKNLQTSKYYCILSDEKRSGILFPECKRNIYSGRSHCGKYGRNADNLRCPTGKNICFQRRSFLYRDPYPGWRGGHQPCQQPQS